MKNDAWMKQACITEEKERKIQNLVGFDPPICGFFFGPENNHYAKMATSVSPVAALYKF